MKMYVRILLLTLGCLLGVYNIYAQTHEGNKTALRTFLRQPSAVTEKTNALQVGLTLTDTLNWITDEAWIEKLNGILRFSYAAPKKLQNIAWQEQKIVRINTGYLCIACTKPRQQ